MREEGKEVGWSGSQDEVTGHGLRFGYIIAELGSQMEVLLVHPECLYTWAVGVSK